MTILATIEENPQPWEASDRFESEVYQQGSDRVILLPTRATEAEAHQMLLQHYPEAERVSPQRIEQAWQQAGYYWGGHASTWKRSQFQCPDDTTELTHTSGNYSGELGFLRHVSYQCSTCQREYVDSCEQTSSGRLSTWQTRIPGGNWQDCAQPPDLLKQNPYGFSEQLLEAYSGNERE